MAQGLTIGQLAKRVGTRAKTIRYYEQIGLLPQAARDDSGYRVYPEGEVDRLRIILSSKSLGLSLREIGEVVGCVAEGHCDEVQMQLAILLGEKLEEVDVRIAELTGLKAGLIQFRSDLERRIRQGSGPKGGSSVADCSCIPRADTELPEKASAIS